MKYPKAAALLLSSLGVIGGIVGTFALQTHAQTSTAAIADTTTAGTATTQPRPPGHVPLGSDGDVTVINGTTITMQEEADESGASNSVDDKGSRPPQSGDTEIQ